jgi:hypothetical protein
MCIWCSFVQNDNDILHTPEHIGRAKAVILSNWQPDDAFSSATKGLHMERGCRVDGTLQHAMASCWMSSCI